MELKYRPFITGMRIEPKEEHWDVVTRKPIHETEEVRERKNHVLENILTSLSHPIEEAYQPQKECAGFLEIYQKANLYNQ